MNTPGENYTSQDKQFSGFISPPKTYAKDIDAYHKDPDSPLRKHVERRRKAREAAKAQTKQSPPGCISEEFALLEISYCQFHDRYDHQLVVAELSRLYSRSYQYIVDTLPSYEASTTLKEYDTANFSASSFGESRIDISDEELEEFGYLGWLR